MSETTTIAKSAPAAPVQLAPRLAHAERLTGNQQLLMDLLLDNLKAGEPVTMDKIIAAYFKADTWYAKSTRDEGVTIYVYDHVIGKYTNQRVPWTHPSARSTVEFRAMSWFRSNLGSCIVKGKLIAIPVIDIPE